MTTPRFHGAPVRGSRHVPLSSLFEGRFGRLFRRLTPLLGPAEPAALEVHVAPLDNLMVEPAAPGGWGGTPEDLDNQRIPAGWTYFGQFVDHDITFDPVSSLDQQNDPDALTDFRTPRFDLDSIYGSGPADEPFQYQLNDSDKFLIGGAAPDLDFPRNAEDLALIGDPRNDENVIVSQIHLLFMRLHNKFVDTVRVGGAAEASVFAEAQRLTRWTYQWIVVNEYLRLIIGDEMFGRLYQTVDKKGQPLVDGPDIVIKHYRAQKRPYMPVEFSAAAFRFGHSMIRGIYKLNDSLGDKPIFVGGDGNPDDADLRGRKALLPGWQIDWPSFFNIGGSNPQLSRKIDTKLVPALSDLPGLGPSLAVRNLIRGYRLGLPSGQDVAKLLRAQVLTPDELQAPLDPTPLWFYILRESEVRAGGQHLGPVGGRIVGEVLLGLLKADTQSFYNRDPTWTPNEILGVTAATTVSFFGHVVAAATA